MLKTVEALRKKHPRFIFESFRIIKNKKTIDIQFLFKLEPDILFSPKVTIPVNRRISTKALRVFAFNLGLVESISYWKAACPAEFIVKCGFLTTEQINWWRDLFMHGLGEFFYQNKVDFKVRDFIKIKVKSKAKFKKQNLRKPSGDLILVSGGKDSAVTLELLKKSKQRKEVLLLNPTKSAIAISKLAGYKKPIIVERKIDPGLKKLNLVGYLNGHTPFSAYLAFLGTLVASLYNIKNVIVSNERSADEGNVIYRGATINHQYSKSGRFEKLFRNYCTKYLSSDINYFSFLRPLYELQVTKIFAGFPQYFEVFKSCNVGQKKNIWCGNCAKCAFCYLSLSPFITHQQLIRIFGSDYFDNKRLINYFKALVGVDINRYPRSKDRGSLIFAQNSFHPRDKSRGFFAQNKPFDCVGTIGESRLAVKLAFEQYQKSGLNVPLVLKYLTKKAANGAKNDKKTLLSWNDRNFSPRIYKNIIKNNIN